MKALICVIWSQKLKGVAVVLLCAIALTRIGILYEKSGLCPLTPLIGLIVRLWQKIVKKKGVKNGQFQFKIAELSWDIEL